MKRRITTKNRTCVYCKEKLPRSAHGNTALHKYCQNKWNVATQGMTFEERQEFANTVKIKPTPSKKKEHVVRTINYTDIVGIICLTILAAILIIKVL